MPLPSDCRWNLNRAARILASAVFVFWLSGLFIDIAAAAEPPSELSAAARDYRIEIYGAFRTNRAEYDARRKQGEALLAEWQTRGAQPDEATVLGRWFDEARRASARQLSLPVSPNWNAAPPARLPVPALPPRGITPPAASPLPLLRALPITRVRAMSHIHVTVGSTGILSPRPSQEPLKLLAALPERFSLGIVWALSDSSLASTASSTLHPMRGALARTDNRTVPLASSTPEAIATTTTPASSEPRTSSDMLMESAELNTAELRARIRGYDKAWRALQIDLYAEEELTLERAATLLTILHDLAQGRRDLLLYQAIVPVALREELHGLATLDELQKQLRQVIDSARTNVATDRSLSQQQRAAFERAWMKLLESQK